MADQSKRAREQAEIERWRLAVARLRILEGNMTIPQVVEALKQLQPPIHASVRTIVRDLKEIRDDNRCYLRAENFDARSEIGVQLARYDLLSRKATTRAMAANGKANAAWARVAILAGEAKTRLLQDLGLVDRSLGTLLIAPDAGKEARRVPSGDELRKRLESITVNADDLVSEAERDWLYGQPPKDDPIEGKPH